MLNAKEYERLSYEELPQVWLDDDLESFEEFLQRNWDARYSLYSDKDKSTKQQFVDFDKKNAIKLNKYIGTINFKGEQLNIFPKIYEDTGSSNKALINDISNWLNYCDKVSFPFIENSSALSEVDNLLELFITVYLSNLSKLLLNKPYYQYEEVTETGSFVKGRIDLRDYYLTKSPRGQKHLLNYTYSDFIFDNRLNQIIKYVCRLLYTKSENSKNQYKIRNLLLELGSVTDYYATPYDCDQIALNYMNNEYQKILDMSKMFLLNFASDVNFGYLDSYCFLFPADQLYEMFISGFIREHFSSKYKVKTQTADQYLTTVKIDNISLGFAFNLREDILLEQNDQIVILDTKYKVIDSFENIYKNKKLDIEEDDVRQMAVYALRRNAKKLYLIYPLRRNEKPETKIVNYNVLVDDKTSSIPLEILKVPFSYSDDIQSTETVLKKILSKCIAD